MTVHRYAVLDADGVKINTITADDEAVNSGWYPGYGFALVDEGENPPDPPPVLSAPKPDTWAVYPELKETLSNGDRFDVMSGAVMRADILSAEVIAEPPVAEPPIRLSVAAEVAL